MLENMLVREGKSKVSIPLPILHRSALSYHSIRRFGIRTQTTTCRRKLNQDQS